MSQNFKNHTRLEPIYHYLTIPLILAVLIGAINNVRESTEGNLYSATLILAICVAMVIIYIYARRFALKAQDRAIRAEENFRHYILTGKPLDARLSMEQIIALRFAADAELPALAQRAVNEGLSNKAIKQAIQHWRADHHRV
jgi:hypothetical protein